MSVQLYCPVLVSGTTLSGAVDPITNSNGGPSAEGAPEWESTFSNRLSDLMRAIDGLEAFLQAHGAGAQALYTARLAIEEMATNTLKYGYDDRAEHLITLRAQAGPEAFRIQLIDDGHEFDPLQAPEPDTSLGIDERKPGGLGIALIRQLVQSVHYERRDGQNILDLTVGRE